MTGRPVLLALLLATLALPLSAFGYLLTGNVSVTTEEIVTVTPPTFKVPARSAGSATFNNVITLDFTKGGFAVNDQVTVLTEILVNDVNTPKGFRSLVVDVIDATAGTVVTTMTLTTPAGEFTVTVPDDGTGNPAAKTYNVKVSWLSGKQEVTAAIPLSAQVTGISR